MDNPSMLIQRPEDLVTPHGATVQGFLEQARQKNELAMRYIEEGKRLAGQLTGVARLEDLVEISDIRDELLFAAGLSTKAKGHLSEGELRSILESALGNIAGEEGENWREEIVYRYLLTRGESFGGSMRNLTGALAGKRFSEAIMGILKEKSIRHKIEYSESNREKISAFEWEKRVLVFDRKSPITGSNIDAILLNTTAPRSSLRERLETGDDYVACGEFKGGIDPAGADEHWKTANSALSRIRTALAEARPKLFFVGAAIEVTMAREIFEQLQRGLLDQAANFTIPKQVNHLAGWLVGL